MTHHIDNRQMRASTAKSVIDVASHCKQNGIDKSEQKKLLRLLGRFATAHELHMNMPLRPPKFR
ncbi:hypothetical protein [Sinorhizobium sp. BG8]|uniref:hypothetical protein n=1 Tax=Sinorhizobium sp. BG8 TaxID=2613773 RepID=UPI00193E35F4|nr:hypothetical protein [Sinorhizobium sp. BG8]QRM55835.1 hypothetical protein F3Y30_15825 [Sinorhizobium sp. BG8]